MLTEIFQVGEKMFSCLEQIILFQIKEGSREAKSRKEMFE